ncbi:uncharacterized protein LOC113147264 [Cyclospora cayetanensis]|uniref:Uncharacterized protein LOC113147264 n=1 Tax=Cyclospora cayetanensis TaxID=88456 RepID=A0A6P6RZP7_9EIME|nr:uncharacterized protein LOC113147264 [Cyclospora cayetanensis]
MMMQRAANTLARPPVVGAASWKVRGYSLGSDSLASLFCRTSGASSALQSNCRWYMGPRRSPTGPSAGSSSSSSHTSSNGSAVSSIGANTSPAASFPIFSTTSMVTVRPSPPTLDSISTAGTTGGPQGAPQTFLREGGITFSFLPKLASNKTFDKAARLTVLLKARHIGCLLGPLPWAPRSIHGGENPGSRSLQETDASAAGEEWQLEAPCGSGYTLRITQHSTKPQTHVCIALLQQHPDQLQPQLQQQKQRIVHLVACSKGEWLTLQMLLQQSLPLLFNWTAQSLQAAAEDEAQTNSNLQERRANDLCSALFPADCWSRVARLPVVGAAAEKL